MKPRILVIDDESAIRDSLKMTLEYDGYEVMLAATGEEGVKLVEREAPDLVFLDIKMPGMDGLEVLQKLRHLVETVPIVVISGHADINTAVEATKLGAFDFIEKPLASERILVTVRNAVDTRRLKTENRTYRKDAEKKYQVVGDSPALAAVRSAIQKAAPTNATVLIWGESGVGKELVARAIHVGSLRSAAVFLPYNCTTTTRELADSQLFGHRRGSFTGAFSDQPGLVRTAGGGTLFLDEIGDLPIDVQPKLLRFLEHGEIMPVGETRPQRVDVRVITATNADLEQRVAEGKFREDLYYRLSVIRIHVPPLRQRREEIPHLSTFFLREASERFGKPDVQLGAEVLELFAGYWWPGNVRQLRNEVQRAVAMAPAGGVITQEHLSVDLTQEQQTGAQPAGGKVTLRGGQTLASVVDDLERELIRETLARHRGNISETARSLGLTRRGLYLKLRRLGLETPSDVNTK